MHRGAISNVWGVSNFQHERLHVHDDVYKVMDSFIPQCGARYVVLGTFCILMVLLWSYQCLANILQQLAMDPDQVKLANELLKVSIERDKLKADNRKLAQERDQTKADHEQTRLEIQQLEQAAKLASMNCEQVKAEHQCRKSELPQARKERDQAQSELEQMKAHAFNNQKDCHCARTNQTRSKESSLRHEIVQLIQRSLPPELPMLG